MCIFFFLSPLARFSLFLAILPMEAFLRLPNEPQVELNFLRVSIS